MLYPLRFIVSSAITLAVLLGSLPAYADLAPRRDLFKQASAIAEKHWREEPFPAARNLCKDVWALLARLGDFDAKSRLYEIGLSTSKQSFEAAAKLHEAGDVRVAAHWLRQVRNTRLPLEERMRGLAIANRFYDFGMTEMPPDAERLCLELIRRSQVQVRETHLARVAADKMSHLTCSEQSREPLEALIRREIETGTRRGILSMESAAACTARDALVALKRINNPESVPQYRWILENSPWPNVQRSAAYALANHGHAEDAIAGLLATINSDYPPPGERAATARALVHFGHTEARSVLNHLLTHNDDRVRASVYNAFCVLGDPAFIPYAVRDLDEHNRHVGFESLGGRGLSHEEPRRSTQIAYLLAVAEKSRESEYRLNALSMLSTRDERVDDVLALALPALQEPLHELPTKREDVRDAQLDPWREQLWKHIAVLRHGTPEAQRTAFARVKEMYENTPHRRFEIVRQIGWSKYEGASEFLYEIMLDPPEIDRPQTQLFATTSLLTILLGINPIE